MRDTVAPVKLSRFAFPLSADFGIAATVCLCLVLSLQTPCEQDRKVLHSALSAALK